MADGALSGDQGLDKLDTAINVASWILADLLLLLLVGLVILVVGGIGGVRVSVGTDTDRSEASELIRGMVRSGLAGFGAGFIVGGVGGRLAMRAASLIDQSAHGSRTEAGFRIGEFTLGGTLELVIFIGCLAVWRSVPSGRSPSDGSPAPRGPRSCPLPSWQSRSGGRLAIDGGNIDFRILDPGWLMAAVFVLLVALTGPIAVWLERKIDGRLDHGEHWARLWPMVVILGAFPATIVLVTLLESDCACLHRPVAAGGRGWCCSPDSPW